MNIQTVLGIDGYSLIVCHCYGKLYRLSIIDREEIIHTCEGIYPTLQAAVERGKSVVRNLDFWQQNLYKTVN